MATEQTTDRWNKVFDEVLVPNEMIMRLLEPLERFASARQAPGAILGVTRPLLQAWESDPPPTDSALHKLIEPVVEAARSLNPEDDRIQPIRDYVTEVKEARAKLNEPSVEVVEPTVDEILIDMELELKLSVIVARLGHQGILNLIDERRAVEGRAVTRLSELPTYLDLQTMEATAVQSATTLSYSAILAKADPGLMTTQQYAAGDDQGEKAPVLRRFAGQWIVSYYTEWEDLFRKQLAVAHGCSVDDIKSTFFQDLGKMRNDFGHGRGICKKSASNKTLKWFTKGEPMIPNHQNYNQLFEEFAEARKVLAMRPGQGPKKVDRQPVRAKVSPELNAEFDAAVAASSGVSADEALADAVRTWIDRNSV